MAAALAVLAAGGGGGSDDASATAIPPPAAPASTPTSSTPPTSAPNRWTPALADSWQWQLRGTLNTGYDVKVYDVDLFDTSSATIRALQQQGRAVVCYFSAGSSENWRPDFAEFLPADLGNALRGWAGERWLDTRSANVRRIMQARLDLAASKGCDGVEPDNMDAYAPDNQAGLPLDAATQLDYNRFIAREARARGLRVGLKNDTEQVAELARDFDFAVNEQCHALSECGVYAAFIQAGKPVFNAEYEADFVSNRNGARDQLCAQARAAGLRTLVLPLELDDSLRIACG
jgi:hypothetical protein